MVAPPNGGGLNQHQQINPSLLKNSHSVQKNHSSVQSLLQQSLVIPEDEQLDSASALAVSIANGKI